MKFHRGDAVSGLSLPASCPCHTVFTGKCAVESEREAKGSGPTWGRRPHPASSLELRFLVSLKSGPEVYSPTGGAGVGITEGGSMAAKLSYWLLETSGVPSRKRQALGNQIMWQVSSSTASSVVLVYDKA